MGLPGCGASVVDRRPFCRELLLRRDDTDVVGPYPLQGGLKPPEQILRSGALPKNYARKLLLRLLLCGYRVELAVIVDLQEVLYPPEEKIVCSERRYLVIREDPRLFQALER